MATPAYVRVCCTQTLPSDEKELHYMQTHSMWRYLCLESRPEYLNHYVDIALRCIGKAMEIPSTFTEILRSARHADEVNAKLFVLMVAATATDSFYNFVVSHSAAERQATEVALKLLETAFRQLYEGLDANHQQALDSTSVCFHDTDDFVAEHRRRVLTGHLVGLVWTPDPPVRPPVAGQRAAVQPEGDGQVNPR